VESTAPAVFEIGFILLAAAIAGWVARRLGLPAVIGYLAVGLVVSPFTPGYVAERQQLLLFADVGVVLLLFEVGIELDPLELGRERGRLFWLAPLQTVLTGALAAAAAFAPRTLATNAGKISATRSTPASVVSTPTLMRMAADARSVDTPIALSTCDGETLPL